MDERDRLLWPWKASQRKCSTSSAGHLLPSTHRFQTRFVKPKLRIFFPREDISPILLYSLPLLIPWEPYWVLLSASERTRQSLGISCGIYGIQPAVVTPDTLEFCSVFSVFWHALTHTGVVLWRFTRVERSVKILKTTQNKNQLTLL